MSKGLALQLPLYAMAAREALPAEEDPTPIDVGYWALRDRGYRPLVSLANVRDGSYSPRDDWRPGNERIVAYVLDLVDRLRRGMLPVYPAEQECERTCDYRVVCRLRQVRAAGKPWPEAPVIEEPADDRPRRGRR